jgi:asparagine synthase (glutamine-hydrolysing)
MCGLAGLLNNTFLPTAADILYSKMVDFGPDSCGIKVYNNEMEIAETGNNILFFNRLAILDLDQRSNQPFEDDRFALTFNGEIYNYAELKKALIKEGYIFHTTSDTEVLFFAL